MGPTVIGPIGPITAEDLKPQLSPMWAQPHTEVGANWGLVNQKPCPATSTGEPLLLVQVPMPPMGPSAPLSKRLGP